MRRIGTAAVVLLALGALDMRPAAPRAKGLAYPAAPREDVTDDYHGTRVADPYRWLERLDGARTIAWLKAEKRVASEALARLPDRAAIRRRLEDLWSASRTEVPWREAGRLFFLRNSGRDPQPALFMQEDARETRTVLDPGTISRDGSIAVGEYAVSPDGRLLAYRAARGGADVGDVHVRELANGRELADIAHGVLTAVCWTRDARGFFYVRPPARAGESGTAARIEKEVRYHALGQPQERDPLVHEWTQGARWVYCMASEDGRWALLVAEQGTESEIWTIGLGDPRHPHVDAPPTRLLADRKAFHTPVDFVGDTLYLRTNLDAARVRIVSLDLREGAFASPHPVVPESGDVISDAVIAGDRLVLHELADVKSRLRLFTLDGTPAGEVALPGIGAVGWPLFGRSADPELFFSFTSFLAPSTVYRFDVQTGARAPFLPPRVPFDARAFETRQVFYTSKDGTRVPMFVTAAKNLTRDATHPTLLTGYGGYGANTAPSFDPALPLWLERGGVWAVANIRGGGEYGEEWHRAGMLGRKQNSFDDFISAAEYLTAERYTTAGRLGMYGHSNGGLLVGAVLTQRPDLFGAAVANAGHYDMLRYPRFTVGAGWVSEYGSPDDP
ncbi:MAG TPA: prolyl oligopeptidase family serine peptidase, partial [Thermoanaerobaculia bacterium]|nr:prolyl oligopeptidase family serine peptidase [Thermoanaerobaculia bacterium]